MHPTSRTTVRRVPAFNPRTMCRESYPPPSTIWWGPGPSVGLNTSASHGKWETLADGVGRGLRRAVSPQWGECQSRRQATKV